MKYNSGQFTKQHGYRSFQPELINKQIDLNTPRLVKKLAEAMRLLGELNAYSELVPDIDYFIKMHVTKEATLSSKIEGTRTNMEEALQTESEIAPEKRDDWQEVQNYITAMNYAVKMLPELPVSTRMTRKIHEKLMQGVRGEHKTPGEFRRTQNWIGGSNLEDAFFIPPHQDFVPELMSDLEKFWHNKQLEIPDLLKIGIAHYQFETIHPFLDGNGRTGRLLIVLQMIDAGILTRPTLYISDFFERNKSNYYDYLTFVRESNKIEQWLEFFLDGVFETANKGKNSFSNILALRVELEDRIIHMGKRVPKARQLLLELFSDPIVSINDVQAKLGYDSYTSASNLVSKFVESGILVEKTGFSRNQLFFFDDYIRLFS